MRTVLIGVAALFVLIVLGVGALIVGGFFGGPALLRARQEANEASTVGSLRAILSAQFTYAAVCGQGTYAPNFDALTRPGPGESVGYLMSDMSGGQTIARSGYTITMTGTPNPQAAASCNGVPAGKGLSTFALTASPDGQDATRYFGANTDGTVYVAAAPFAMPETGAPSGATPVQ